MRKPSIEEVMPDDEFLRVEPDCTGFTKMGKSYIHQEIAAGRLKSYRFGRAVRVKRSDLLAWIEAQKARAA